MGTYKWNNPHDWLSDHIENASLIELHSVIRDLLSKIDADDLQDLFQTEMDADGYFDNLEKKTSGPRCSECGCDLTDGQCPEGCTQPTDDDA